ncbi:hypothetical protein [Blastococcus sp. TF02-8]|uniref:hypothetical protein n=1 Tax=Blastococcus sp. TF02-8 TaxID=2250574 RepID=UPI001411B892|nr:hypothetical protein [Blastococcus sp. TF02-8]
MVQSLEPDRSHDDGDTTDEQSSGGPENAGATDQVVPDKQIYRWKDDGGAVMPDS